MAAKCFRCEIICRLIEKGKAMKKYIFLPRISERTARALPARLFAVGLSLIFAEQFAARLLLDGAIRSEMSLCGRLLVCSAAAEYALAAMCVLVGGVLLLNLAVRGKL